MSGLITYMHGHDGVPFVTFDRSLDRAADGRALAAHPPVDLQGSNGA